MIIFDCDGVLIDSEIISNAADAEAFTANGFPITTREMIARFMGRPKREIWAEIESEMGRPLPAGLIERIEADIKRRYREELAAIPGVAAAIAAVGGPRCVASSSEMSKLRLALEVTGLLPLFDPHVFSASQVARGKPAPDLFLYAAATMAVDPARCLVVEDSQAGVIAARAAGMRVIGFTGGSHSFDGHAEGLIAAGAERTIVHMDALAQVIAEARSA